MDFLRQRWSKRERKGVIRPPHTRVEHRRPPDDASDEAERVDKEQAEASRGPGEVVEATGNDAVETRRPEGRDEVEGAACVEACPPEGVQVAPGGDTGNIARNASVAHERTDVGTSGEVGGASPDAEIEGEMATLPDESMEGGRASAMARTQLITAADEGDHRTSRIDDYSPEPPAPPKPPGRPLERPRRKVEPPSVELEGRWWWMRAATTAAPAAMRTRRECRVAVRALETDQKSSTTRQNESANRYSE